MTTRPLANKSTKALIAGAVKSLFGQMIPTWGYYTVPPGPFGLRNFMGWGGSSNYARQNVTVDTTLQLSAAWSCIRLLSETVATLPAIVYRDLPFDARAAAKDYFLYPILHDRPNADHTAVEFWEGVVMSLCCWGNAYARKNMLGGRLVSLDPWSAECVTVYRDPDTRVLGYRYRDPITKEFYDVPESQVFHVRGFGPCADEGLSPISFARQSLGLAMSENQVAATTFANGARPSGVLKIDQVIRNEQQRAEIQENIVRPFVGAVNGGGVMLLEGGMDFKPVSMNLADVQLLQTRQFSIEEICRWFRVPPMMIGHMERSTSWGTGLEQQNAGFLIYALRPYLTRIEQAISRQLIPVEDRDTYHPEFKVDALLRADSAVRVANYATLVQNGIMTRNEVRRLENLPPLPGGDLATAQSQNVPLGQTAKPQIETTSVQQNPKNQPNPQQERRTLQ